MSLARDFAIDAHVLYISVTEIEISESMEFEMVVKVFSDDLYSSMFNKDSSLISSEFKWDLDEVSNYFNSKIKLKSGVTPVPIILKKINIEGESSFLHYEGGLPSGSTDLEVQLAYFYELFPTQRNVLKLKKGEIQKHSIFNSAEQINRYELH